MPWEERDVVEQRRDLIAAVEAGSSISEAARRAGVSRKTASKWWHRHQRDGDSGLVDRSRARVTRPDWVTPPAMVELVLSVRDRLPTWGGRKIRVLLLREGHVGVPAASTITAILNREGRIQKPVRPQRDYVRFEAAAPNDLWQMDFKGQFGLTAGGKCYPFTVIDDHSRFLVNLTAGPNNQKETVKGDLTTVFRTVGLPETILCDYGAPWGYEPGSPFTQLVAWLISLNVNVIHGRPRHPQTRGKNERIHRTLKEDVLARDDPWNTLDEVQVAFDEWRPIYNYYRPHQGIGMAVPADRYQPSVRLFPEVIPPPDYPNPKNVRSVDPNGKANWKGRLITAGHAFTALPIYIDEHEDGSITISYYQTIIRTLEPGRNL